MKCSCGGFNLGEGLQLDGDKLQATALIQLYSDGNAIYMSEESETPLTFEEVKELLNNPMYLVTLYNGNYILRPEYTRPKGTQHAVWFNGVTTLDGEPYIYRIVINSDNEVLADEYHLALANS